MNDFQEYEAVFIHASIGIIVVDGNAFIQSINPFALSLFNYTREDIIKHPIETLVPSRFRQNHVHHRNQYLQNEKNRPMGVGMDLIAVKKDGTEFPVEISLAHYKNNTGDNVIVFISDISIRKNSEKEVHDLKSELESQVEQRTHQLTEALQQLNRSKDELSKSLEKERELSELKSRFVSMASHEFRTPLSTIQTSAYLIGKYQTSQEQPNREKHLHRIISAVSMLTDTLNDFLSVGKLEEGKIQVRTAEINIQELIIGIAGEMKNTLKTHQKIHYHHQGSPHVMLDPSLLKHIVMNLLSNASKFSPEAAAIDVRTIYSGGRLELSVKDHGIGISKDDQQHLMERFFRGANAGNIQGTGLGLHIVSKYAELLNGKIVCKSELNKGTEFIVTFTINNTST